MKFICPLLVVEDISLSREFYEKILRQKVKYDFGENVTFHGDFSIHLKSHFTSLIDNRNIAYGANNFELYFEYDQIEEIEAVLKEHDIRFVHEMREQPWRQRVVRIYDPDMHIIEIAESIEYLAFRLSQEGKNEHEICFITNMSAGFVREALKKYKS